MAKEIKEVEVVTALPCGITQAQLDGWKNEYGKDAVKHIEVAFNGHTYSGVFRKPDFDSFTKAVKYLTPDPASADKQTPRDMFKAGLIYFHDCKLQLDPEMESVEEIKAGACVQLVQLFKPAQATLKNL